MWRAGRTLRILKGHSAGVGGMALSEDGRRALSASQDNTVNVWNLETGEVHGDVHLRCRCLIALRLPTTGSSIVVGDDSGRVHFLRLEESKAKS